MSNEDKRIFFKDSISSELLKKGLSSGNLATALATKPAASGQNPQGTPSSGPAVPASSDTTKK